MSMQTTSSTSKSPLAPAGLVSGTFRFTVQTAAKRFKSSWVELGRLLVQVRDQALYAEWGYDSFDSYCFKEIHIRKQTAAKLTRSFQFLKNHEPETASASPAESPSQFEAPPFEVIEVLAQAEDRGQLSAQEYKSIRDSIWSGEKSVPEVRRELTERFPTPPEPLGNAGALTLPRLAALANKLVSEMRAQKKVPKALIEQAAAVAAELESLK